MKISLYDIILIITVIQLLVFTAFLFTKRPNKLSNITLGLFLFTQAAVITNLFLISQFGYISNNFPNLFLIGYPFCLCWGPLFYFYVKSLESSDFRFRISHLLHFIPFAAEVVFLTVSFYFLDAASKIEILTTQSD